MFATLASVLSYGIDPCNALAPRHLASVINPCLAIADTPAFNILPHPAKTNNPADLDSEPAAHGGLQSAGMNAYNAKGPHVVSDEVAKGLEEPKSREEVSNTPWITGGLELTL